MCSRLQYSQLILLSFVILNYNASNFIVRAIHCRNISEHANKLQFSVVRHCQRSRQKLVALENTWDLEECIGFAKQVKGLAINYAPQSRRNTKNYFANVSNDNDIVFYFNSVRQLRRQHFWQQPEEFFNCHILECPENSTYKTMINDSRFDYFSLYGIAPASTNYSCIPHVGIFQLHSIALNYKNAAKSCATNSSGALAHVTSSNRTNNIALLLTNYNHMQHSMQNYRAIQGDSGSINLAYVGLHFNRSWIHLPFDFLTPTNESLKCYLYRAWAPGHPKRSGAFLNTSCVAISTSKTWVTVDCEQKLPFICELYTSKPLYVDNKKYNNLKLIEENNLPAECFL